MQYPTGHPGGHKRKQPASGITNRSQKDQQSSVGLHHSVQCGCSQLTQYMPRRTLFLWKQMKALQIRFQGYCECKSTILMRFPIRTKIAYTHFLYRIYIAGRLVQKALSLTTQPICISTVRSVEQTCMNFHLSDLIQQNSAHNKQSLIDQC